MAQKHIDRPFEVKSVSADGTFTGIASPFGELDSHYDIVLPGAFAKSLATFEERKRKVPMLWQHNSREPIGVYTSLKETDTELLVTGQCNMKVQRGQECHALMEQGALTGLSIGFNTVNDEWDEKGMVRRIKEVDLWEISPVTFPSADSARVLSVKTIDTMETLSDMEKLLRDVGGFTKSEALAFVARVKSLAQRSESADVQPDDLKKAMAILRGETTPL